MKTNTLVNELKDEHPHVSTKNRGYPISCRTDLEGYDSEFKLLIDEY